VSFDTVAENAAFAEKFAFPYPLLCDTDRSIGLAYHATADPKTGSAKRITYVIGPDGTIRQAHETVNTREHPKTLLESLE
jgi:peroxiredoxin Q/BCP